MKYFVTKNDTVIDGRYVPGGTIYREGNEEGGPLVLVGGNRKVLDPGPVFLSDIPYAIQQDTLEAARESSIAVAVAYARAASRIREEC